MQIGNTSSVSPTRVTLSEIGRQGPETPAPTVQADTVLLGRAPAQVEPGDQRVQTATPVAEPVQPQPAPSPLLLQDPIDGYQLAPVGPTRCQPQRVFAAGGLGADDQGAILMGVSPQVLVGPEARFPDLEKGAVHHKCTVQGGDGYPSRQFSGPVAWSQANPDYHPTSFTHPSVAKGPVWADPADPQAASALRPGSKFQSYEGEVTLVDGTTPRNPRGRTNVAGRGLLGKWGANNAADPIVTRVNPHSGKLEMICIQRKDTHEWAIPGGMVDFDEPLSGTLSRELAEEALGKEATPDAVKALEQQFRDRFQSEGHQVYAGYVDDPRNTDNAWMETKAVHLHLTGADANIKLIAGDDAGKARWQVVNQDTLSHLYASHGDFVAKAVQDFQASTGQRVLSDGTVV